MVADHLLRLKSATLRKELRVIIENFLDKQLLNVRSKGSWYANLVNYLECAFLPHGLTH